MIKRLVVLTLLAVPCVQADWIDDLAGFIENGTLDQMKAANAVQRYITQDEHEVTRLEKKLEANDEDGFWATVRGGTYQVQWAAAKASLRYHTKVLDFIKALPKNERDRERLIEHLTALNKNNEELVQLKKEYAEASGWGESAKMLGLIAAKEFQIKGRKALIKSSFIV